jgi:hypothetical protein
MAKPQVMQQLFQGLNLQQLISNAKKMGVGSLALIAFLLALLILTVVVTVLGWRSAAGTTVPTSGYVALAAGVLFSLVVGVGLMALVFYSSRSGYDEPAKLIEPDESNENEASN